MEMRVALLRAIGRNPEVINLEAREAYMSSVLGTRRLSVVQGGPLDRLHLRLGLMKLHAPLIVRGSVIFALIVWVPLLIPSAFQMVLLTNGRIPFLYDSSAHIRFLLSVPLLIVAEVVIGPRIVAATSPEQ
jgi:hypothetical protein